MLLHKDLGREQLARKRLHNEMEDMKGKIRVYVRIRPFSRKEKDMGCTEAVLKVNNNFENFNTRCNSLLVINQNIYFDGKKRILYIFCSFHFLYHYIFLFPQDGKLTVMVKGLGGVPDARKVYDFDQVQISTVQCSMYCC